MRSPRTDARGRARWLPFVVIGVALAAAQLLLTNPGRGPSWDEAIYLSQVKSPALLFAPQRSRGIVLLVAPLVALGAPLTWIRVTLALGSSAALVAAAAAWGPLVGTSVAAAAAALSAGSWLVLFYGSEVMPNLWSALGIFAACALLARGLAAGEERPRWPALLLVAATGLVRPLDAALAGFALVVVTTWRSRSWRWPAWIAGAVALGWVPWLVEMSVRYGGPIAALRAAADVGRVGERGLLDAIRLHLALADGPPVGFDGGPIAWPAVAWWLVVGAAAILALLRARGAAREAAWVAVATGITIVAGYVGFVGGEAPRYLLPALVLLTMAAAIGTATLPRSAVAAVAVAALAWGVWQVGVLADVHGNEVAQRADARAAGLAVHALSPPGPCEVWATDAFPQIAVASGCHGRWLRGEPRQVATGDFVVTPEGDPMAGLGAPVAYAGGYAVYVVGGASTPT